MGAQGRVSSFFIFRREMWYVVWAPPEYSFAPCIANSYCRRGASHKLTRDYTRLMLRLLRLLEAQRSPQPPAHEHDGSYMRAAMCACVRATNTDTGAARVCRVGALRRTPTTHNFTPCLLHPSSSSCSCWPRSRLSSSLRLSASTVLHNI